MRFFRTVFVESRQKGITAVDNHCLDMNSPLSKFRTVCDMEGSLTTWKEMVGEEFRGAALNKNKS